MNTAHLEHRLSMNYKKRTEPFVPAHACYLCSIIESYGVWKFKQSSRGGTHIEVTLYLSS